MLGVMHPEFGIHLLVLQTGEQEERGYQSGARVPEVRQARVLGLDG